MAAPDRSIELARIAAVAAAEKKAEDIVVLDVSGQLVITDCFVVCSGDNERMVNAIAEEIEDTLAEAGVKPVRREGNREGRWVLLDYNEVVVHVQRSPEREFYGLDSLWKDCPRVEVPGLEDQGEGVAARLASGAGNSSLTAASVDELPLAGREPDADEL